MTLQHIRNNLPLLRWFMKNKVAPSSNTDFPPTLVSRPTNWGARIPFLRIWVWSLILAPHPELLPKSVKRHFSTSESAYCLLQMSKTNYLGFNGAHGHLFSCKSVKFSQFDPSNSDRNPLSVFKCASFVHCLWTCIQMCTWSQGTRPWNLKLWLFPDEVRNYSEC